MRQRRPSTLSPFARTDVSGTPQYRQVSSRPLARYVHPVLGRSLLQVMADRGYWTHTAAMTFGLMIGLLLIFFALVALACLQSEFEAVLMTAATRWTPEAGAIVGALIQQTRDHWDPLHQWLLLSLSGGTALSLWLKGITVMQQSLRASVKLSAKSTAVRPLSLRRRVGISLIAAASALLLLLAYGLVFMVFPSASAVPPSPPIGWSRGHELLLQGLRWSLALSSVALLLGLFYRVSLTASTTIQPILPGTVFATGCWAVLPLLLKGHLQVLSHYHWLYGALGTLLLCQVGLYLSLLGVLVGGLYNSLVNQPLVDPRSRLQPTKPLPPPPSLESFTIHRRTGH